MKIETRVECSLSRIRSIELSEFYRKKEPSDFENEKEI